VTDREAPEGDSVTPDGSEGEFTLLHRWFHHTQLSLRALSHAACLEDKIARRRQEQTSEPRGRMDPSRPYVAAASTGSLPGMPQCPGRYPAKHHRPSRGEQVGYLEQDLSNNSVVDTVTAETLQSA
jgi:hypothetical protein